MSMYYGDSSGKAKKVVLTGIPGPQGPQGPQGEVGPQGPADTSSIKLDGSSTTTARIPFEKGISTTEIYPRKETGMLIGSDAYAPGFVDAVRPVIISASSLHNQAPRITVGKENGNSLEQITVSVRTSIGEREYTPKIDDSIVHKKYVDDKIQASTEDLEAGVSPLETGKLYVVYE